MRSKIISNLITLRFVFKKNLKISEQQSLTALGCWQGLKMANTFTSSICSQNKSKRLQPMVGLRAHNQRESRVCLCGNVLLTICCCVVEPQQCHI